MSDVISFRLNDKNPREAQAREVIEVWVKQGYSIRQIIVESLLLLGNETAKSNTVESQKMDVVADRLTHLLEKLEGRLENITSLPKDEPELSASFVSSIKKTAKAGLRVND